MSAMLHGILLVCCGALSSAMLNPHSFNPTQRDSYLEGTAVTHQLCLRDPDGQWQMGTRISVSCNYSS